MSESALSHILMQVTDGHPATAADAVRRRTESKPLNCSEQVVLVALLRHTREASLKARVLGGPVAPRRSAARA